MEQDVKEVVLELGSHMIKLAGKGDNLEKNKQIMLENVQNGKALDKFKELIENQGGDVSYIENPDKFEKAKFIMPVIVEKSGTIQSLKAEEVGKISVSLGAGRIKKEDVIDNSVGIVLEKKVGNAIKQGEIACYVHANDEMKGTEAVKKLQEIYNSAIV